MKLVVSQQSVVGSQEATKISLAPTLPDVWKMKKAKNAAWRILLKCTAMFGVIISFTGIVHGQPNSDSLHKKPAVDMATGLRSNGKIYVVVAVLIIILAGLFFYLIRLDRKINQLEKEKITNNE